MIWVPSNTSHRTELTHVIESEIALHRFSILCSSSVKSALVQD